MVNMHIYANIGAGGIFMVNVINQLMKYQPININWESLEPWELIPLFYINQLIDDPMKILRSFTNQWISTNQWEFGGRYEVYEWWIHFKAPKIQMSQIPGWSIEGLNKSPLNNR